MKRQLNASSASSALGTTHNGLGPGEAAQQRPYVVVSAVDYARGRVGLNMTASSDSSPPHTLGRCRQGRLRQPIGRTVTASGRFQAPGEQHDG